MTSLANRHQFEPSIFRVRSHDVDEISQLARAGKWKTEVTQLEPGLLNAQTLIAHLGGIQFSRLSWNLAALHRGVSPRHTITFAFPLTQQDSSVWYGHPISLQQVIVHHSEREIDLRGSGPKELAVITLKVEDLFELAMPEDKANLDQIFSKGIYVLPVNPMATLRLTHFLKDLFALVETQPSRATHPAMQPIIRKDFLPLLLDFLDSGQLMPESNPSNHYRLVKKVEAYMLAQPDQPLTLHDLCEVSGAKRRTLQNAFLDVLGISPMAYLKIQRLHGVWRQLKLASPKTATVMGIAIRWGFWHMGHFSHDYKAMFGEPPSETLRESRIKF
jgi:AraC family ethanolamine operon transcriptional activator